MKTHFFGPYPPGYEKAFEPYVTAGAKSMNSPDAVLIDGRSRLACAQAASQILRPGGLAFFHDFYAPGRERYRKIPPEMLQIESIKQGQTLAVFRKI